MNSLKVRLDVKYLTIDDELFFYYFHCINTFCFLLFDNEHLCVAATTNDTKQHKIVEING